MLGNPFNLIIQDMSLETGRVYLKIAGRLAEEIPDYTETSFTAYTGLGETFVYAISVIKEKKYKLKSCP